jgi:hypothetical protein
MRRLIRWGLSCVLLANPLVADAVDVNADVRIVVQIPRVMRLRALDLPSTIALSADDISRGEVVVKGRLDVLVNDPRGYALEARPMGRAFPGFRIQGLARVVETDGDPVAVSMPSMVGMKAARPFPVEYHLRIAPDTVPGRYPWPVLLTLHNP